MCKEKTRTKNVFEAQVHKECTAAVEQQTRPLGLTLCLILQELCKLIP